MELPLYNLNYFKVFMAVYEYRSMTRAAEALHLTQSGVSQHIQSLEGELDRQLFHRVGRRLVPTELAHKIYPDIEEAILKVRDRLQKATGQNPEPAGVIRIGMPIEFGKNVLIPKLAKLGTKYKKLVFEIVMGSAYDLGRQLIEGQLDFAFMDETPLDRRFTFQAVASEELLLCGLKDYVAGKPKVRYAQSYFEELEYVEYTGTEPILRRWMLHHLKRKNLKLKVRAHILDVQGLAKFIISGLGVGVLPDHVVAKLKSEGVELYVYEGKTKPLRNEIRLVRTKYIELSEAAQLTMKFLTE